MGCGVVLGSRSMFWVNWEVIGYASLSYGKDVMVININEAKRCLRKQHVIVRGNDRPYSAIGL